MAGGGGYQKTVINFLVKNQFMLILVEQHSFYCNVNTVLNKTITTGSAEFIWTG